MFDFSLEFKMSDGFDKFYCRLLWGNVLLRERTGAQRMTPAVAFEHMHKDNLEFEH